MVRVEIKNIEKEYSVVEAYKSIRTNLQFCGMDKKVITVTSCVENEGKSTVVLNLAVSLAEAGKKVIVLDADLRKSELLNRVSVKSEVKGLSFYLSNQVKLEDVICATDIENLHLVFSGPVPPNPSELIESSYFKDMIQFLSQKYDYVLIDTPPLGSVIDSAIAAEVSDGAILVIESERVSYRLAREVKIQLEKSNCPILGVVLNKVDISSMSYYGKMYTKYAMKQ